ncbi:MAG: anti-sigma factor family protein [bacterium]
MMRHKEIENLIQKKLDREITQDEELFLSEHLKECPDCHAYHLEMERIKDEIMNLTEFFPRADFNARIFVKIGTKHRNYWYKLIPAFISVYLTSLIILLFSPLLNHLFQKAILVVPYILQVSDKIELTCKGIMLLAPSILKLNIVQFAFGFLLCLLVFYVFIKTISNFKEEKWVTQEPY